MTPVIVDYGYEPKENAMIDKAVELFRAVAIENWAAVMEARSKSAVNKAKVSVSFVIDCGGKKPLITGKLSVSSQKHTADFSEYVENGEQKAFEFQEVGK